MLMRSKRLVLVVSASLLWATIPVASAQEDSSAPVAQEAVFAIHTDAGGDGWFTPIGRLPGGTARCERDRDFPTGSGQEKVHCILDPDPVGGDTFELTDTYRTLGTLADGVTHAAGTWTMSVADEAGDDAGLSGRGRSIRITDKEAGRITVLNVGAIQTPAQ